MTLPQVQLSGSPYQQGVQHGRALRKQIDHNLHVYFDRFLREGGVGREEVLSRAQRYGEAIATQTPAYYEGMRGIAAGAGQPLVDIVALNVRYEILYYQYTVNQIERVSADGCTSFAIAPEASANGHLLLGQNWDWIPEVQGALLHTTHDDAPATLAFTEAGIFGGKIGLNSAGLGLAINGITTTSDDWARLKSPFHVRCYEILRQTSLAAARAVVHAGGRACSGNYLIAALPDQVVNLEAAPDVVNELGWESGCLVHANHFVDPEALSVLEPPDELYRQTSCRRQARLEELLARRPVHVEDLQRYLRDHNTAPRDICRHEDPEAPIDERYRTVTSIIIDLDEEKLWATDGPACQDDFTLYQLKRE
ncbi:MAG: C45 family peptidase [Candidatus Promineifilaceae bacterium]|nr:C45 family peptidase [Candidatus Promineifilaceae bacterium]